MFEAMQLLFNPLNCIQETSEMLFPVFCETAFEYLYMQFFA